MNIDPSQTSRGQAEFRKSIFPLNAYKKAIQLSGYQRVCNFQSPYRIFNSCEIHRTELLKFMKRDFNFLQVKLSLLSTDQVRQIDLIYSDFERQIINLQSLVPLAPLHTRVQESFYIEVELVSSAAVRLFRLVQSVDQILSQLAIRSGSESDVQQALIRYSKLFMFQFSRIKKIASQFSDGGNHTLNEERSLRVNNHERTN